MSGDKTIVYLGNRAAIETSHDATGREVRRALSPGKRRTTVEPPSGAPLAEVFTAITASGGVWAYHSSEPPAWVASTDPALAQLLAAHYGCELRAPEPHHGDDAPKG
ncbi:hypothetical protein [Spirillospora sp. CA-294931]|uniref:hypothetical protein n=1 Tax=Spirillospora sp. CA-294931 TaxID=3240042 RepID=UPI003D8E38B9